MKFNFKHILPLIPILFLLFYNKVIENFYVKLLLLLLIIVLLSYNAYKNKAIKNPKIFFAFLIITFATTAFYLINF